MNVIPVGKLAPLAKQRQEILDAAGGTNAAVETGSAVAEALVPINGTKSNRPSPAAFDVLLLMIPVSAAMAMLSMLAVADGDT